MKALCETQKKTVAEWVKKLDVLIRADREPEIEGLIREFNAGCRGQIKYSQQMKEMFFIWIGHLQPEALEYIAIWQQVAGHGVRIRIYYDGHFILFNHYARAFRRLYGVTAETPAATQVRLQNRFQRDIDALVQRGATFDEALIAVMRRFSPREAARLERARDRARHDLSALARSWTLVDIRQDPDLFFDAFFYRIYALELTLRANAAAAADVLRLLILYRYGGVYVDVDTLPGLVPVYGECSATASRNIQNIVRSEYFLRRWRQCFPGSSVKPADISIYEQYLEQRDANILQEIGNRARHYEVSKLPFQPVEAHPDLLTLAGLDHYYEYNNNVLAAEKNSRLVRIILSEIRRRYTCIFRNGWDNGPNARPVSQPDLARLVHYRLDALSDQDHVTLFLTGPVLLLEVMLGVAYEVLSLEKSIHPLAVSYAFRLDCIAVSYRGQTCYTPAHMKSSWR